MLEYGLWGHLPVVLLSFLKGIFVQVRVGGHLSSPQPLINGVSLSSVLSVTLFLIAIKEIISNINFSLTQILFVDDFSIHLKSNNPQRARRLLQESIKSIEDSSWILTISQQDRADNISIGKKENLLSPLSYSVETNPQPISN